MPKKPNTSYFLYDDGVFDYTGLVEPTSQNAMLGYKAIAWNTGLQWTGWWQGRNVLGMSTTDPLFDMSKGDISQAVQIQQTWKPYAQLPWLWESNQGQSDSIHISAEVAMPVSYGTNLRQANFLFRYEDVSKLQPGTDHGQRIWIQPSFFDSQNIKRPIDIYRDPYTNYEDIVVNVQIRPNEYKDYFDFSGSAAIQQSAHDNLLHFEFGQSRLQLDNLLRLIERDEGIDLQNETGYWSLIQVGITAEMASFPANAPKFGIGSYGAQQMAMMDLAVWDG